MLSRTNSVRSNGHQDIMSGTKSLCPGAGSAPGAESFGRPTGRAGPTIRAGALVICRCTGLNDVDLKQANPVGQTALRCAVVLHGPKSNLVGIPEDEKRRCCQVAAAEENVVQTGCPDLAKWTGLDVSWSLFITTRRATTYRCRMPGAQTSDNHVVDLRPAAVIIWPTLTAVIKPSSPCTSV